MFEPAEVIFSEKAHAIGYSEPLDLKTRGIDFLRACNIPFRSATFTPLAEITPPANTEESKKPKTQTLRDRLGVNEHNIIKSLIFKDTKTKKPFVILMHGDCMVNTSKLARSIGSTKVKQCCVEMSKEHSGYVPGGTSAFGLADVMPIVVQKSILELPGSIIISAGALNTTIVMQPKDIVNAFESEYAKSLGYASCLVVDCSISRQAYDVTEGTSPSYNEAAPNAGQLDKEKTAVQE